MESLIALFFTLCFANNIVLVELLGINPVAAKSSSINTVVAYTVETAAILLIATLLNFLLYHTLLVPFGLEALKLVCFMVVIGALVQALEIVLTRRYAAKARYLGQYLPLILANCAILGVSLDVALPQASFIDMLVKTAASAIGFVIVMLLLVSLHGQISMQAVPKPFQGLAIHCVSLALLSLAFMGMTGL